MQLPSGRGKVNAWGENHLWLRYCKGSKLSGLVEPRISAALALRVSMNTSPDRHLLPLLPEFLPGLLSGMSEEIKRQFIDGSVQIYQALYEALIRQVPDWESELRLELAASLIKLPSHEAGIAQVNASLKVWLSYRGIDWQLSTPVMPLLVEVAKPEDESYFNSLYQVWELLGITDRVDMGNAYYRRGIGDKLRL